MNFSNVNKAFKEQWNFIPVTDDTDKGQLSDLLNRSIQELKSKDTTDINTYFIAFIDDIESVFPDAPWYNSVGLDIRNDLFNTQNPEVTAKHILDSIVDAGAYSDSELREAPEDTETELSKFKKDKALLDRESGMYQRLKDADSRVSSIRDRMAKNKAKMSESWSDTYIGTTAVFKVKPGFDTAENWGVSEAEMKEIFLHNSDRVKIQGLSVEGIPTNFKNSFWNIRFDDGLVLDGVSGYNLYQ